MPSTRKYIEETCGAICPDFGSTAEMSPWMTDGKCARRRGMHLWQDVVYAERSIRKPKGQAHYRQTRPLRPDYD